MMRSVLCTHCGFHLFRKGMDRKWRLSCVVTIVENEESDLVVVCRRCGKESDFPAKLMFNPILSVDPKEKTIPTLVISKSSGKNRKKLTP